MQDLVFSSYKEPLRPIEKGKGYGYYGAILYNPDRSLMQCHVCGEMFANVSAHINLHKMTVTQYREQFEIAKTTSLISEAERERLKANGVRAWAMKTPEEKAAFIASGKTKHRNKKGFLSLETKNKRGNCPDQLLDAIGKVAEKLGKTPTVTEFRREMTAQKRSGMLDSIYSTFGSWQQAVRLSGRTPKGSGRDRQCPYTEDELLDILKNYFDTYGTLPTKSDSARGLIPSQEYYRYYWGGMPKARAYAGLPDLPTRGKKMLEAVYQD